MPAMIFLPTQLGRHQWDAEISKAGGAIQQSWAYGEASGCDVQRLEIMSRGRRIGLVQVLSKRFRLGIRFALMDRGPVWIGKAPNHSWLDGWDARQPLIHTPEIESARSRGLPLMSAASIAEIDLSRSLENLRAGLHQKWRNRLVRAEDCGLSIETSRDLRWITKREEENRRRLGYRGWPASFLNDVCMDQNTWILLVAKDRGRSVAAGLFLFHGSCATYQIGWSGAEGRRKNAQTLVLWSAIRRLKEAGITSLELGLLDTHRAAGLARFKLGTGARARRLGVTRLVLGPPKATSRHKPAFNWQTSMR